MTTPYDHTHLEPFYSAVDSPEEAARYNHMVARVVEETGFYYAPFEPIHVGASEVWVRRVTVRSPGGCKSVSGDGVIMGLGAYRLRYEQTEKALREEFPVPEA